MNCGQPSSHSSKKSSICVSYTFVSALCLYSKVNVNVSLSLLQFSSCLIETMKSNQVHLEPSLPFPANEKQKSIAGIYGEEIKCLFVGLTEGMSV